MVHHYEISENWGQRETPQKFQGGKKLTRIKNYTSSHEPHWMLENNGVIPIFKILIEMISSLELYAQLSYQPSG